MKRLALLALTTLLMLPILSSGDNLSFSLDGDTQDVFLGDVDGDGRHDFLFGTWHVVDAPLLQYFWHRGNVYFYSGKRRVFVYPTGAYVSSVVPVNFGERLIAAGTTFLEGRPASYVYLFDLEGERRGLFKTDGKVKKLYPLFGGSKLLVLNYREPSNETEFLVLGKNGFERSFVLNDLIEEVLQTDLENDGEPELLAGSVFDGDWQHFVYIFDENFFKIGRMGTEDLIESLDASDLDGDGIKEIIAGTYNYVYAFKKDGTQIWRHELPIGPVLSLKVVDFNDDSSKETIFTSQKGIYVLDGSGNLISEKELPYYGHYIFMADWDGDGSDEIIFSNGKDFSILEQSDFNIVPIPASTQPPATQPPETIPPVTQPPQTTVPPMTTQSPQSTLFPAVIKLCGVNPVTEEITLCNNGIAPIDVGGWTLSDNSGSYTISPGTIILSSGSWTVGINTYNPTRNTKGLYLDDNNDFLELRDKNGNLIDKKTWGTPIIYLI